MFRKNLKDSTLILPQDAVYTAENYGPPVLPTKNMEKPECYMASIERIRQLEKETGATVIFPHDNQQFQTLKKAPEWYE